MTGQIITFVFAMWLLLLAVGGIFVLVLGPISISGYSDLDQFLSSGIKAVIAILLVIGWIFVLSKVKNWIFRKQIKV